MLLVFSDSSQNTYSENGGHSILRPVFVGVARFVSRPRDRQCLGAGIPMADLDVLCRSGLFHNHILHRPKHQVLVLFFAVFTAGAAIVFSSWICVGKVLSTRSLLFEIDERNFGLWIMNKTRPDAVLLVQGWHASPMMTLGGRLMTMGSAWSVKAHGIDYGARREWINALVDDRENVTRFLAAGITYTVAEQGDGSDVESQKENNQE
jgi:hypothetical protein